MPHVARQALPAAERVQHPGPARVPAVRVAVHRATSHRAPALTAPAAVVLKVPAADAPGDHGLPQPDSHATHLLLLDSFNPTQTTIQVPEHLTSAVRPMAHQATGQCSCYRATLPRVREVTGG